MSSTAGALTVSKNSKQLAAVMAATCLLLFAGLAIWLAERRIRGAFSQPLNGSGLVVAAMAMALVAVGLRRLKPAIDTESGIVARRLFSTVPSVAVVIALGSLTFAGTPTWAVIVAWLVVLGFETVNYWPDIRLHLRPMARLPVVTAIDSSHASIAEDAEVPAGLVQQLTRVREADGESIHVLVGAEIPAGDRLGVVHISFCPPLESRPVLTAHAVEADDVEVRLTQVEAFGARVEIRAEQDQTEARRVVVEVIGSVTAKRVTAQQSA